MSNQPQDQTTSFRAKLTNNEDQSFQVDQATFDSLQQAFRQGNFSAIVNDISGGVHCIILEANFNY